MTKIKKIILTLVLAIILFCLSFFYVKNEICCMFASIRHRGFPYQIISISKVTEEFEEAEKVYSFSDLELLNQGWKLKIDSGFNPLLWSISFNFIFYLAISGGLIFIAERIKQRKHGVSEI